MAADPDGDGDPLNNVAVFNIRFPGQYYDAESGLHYNRFRYYDPSIGRYISADPIGQWGDVNLYRYSLGSPLRLIDPRGLYVAYEGGPGGEIHLAVEAARQEWEYLGQDDPVSDLEDSDDFYQFVDGGEFTFSPDGGGGIISIDPGGSLKVSPDDDERGQGGTLSSEDLIHHEACHAQNKDSDPGYRKRRNAPNEKFLTDEEENVITGPERELQRRKGGPERKSHGGTYRLGP